jgi:hypothetical protein
MSIPNHEDLRTRLEMRKEKQQNVYASQQREGRTEKKFWLI